jgi:chromosome condensin MukBEF ATPase and DNA-binding subunit MukB
VRSVNWVPVAAWGGAAVLAVVVLGWCAYDIAWKARRLQRDLRTLQARAAEAEQLRAALAQVEQRLAATGLR